MVQGPAPPGGELLSIQALRGGAVLTVVLMRVSAYLRARFDIHLLPPFDVGAAGVDIFFVISGFVMVYASERLFGRRGATASGR